MALAVPFSLIESALTTLRYLVGDGACILECVATGNDRLDVVARHPDQRPPAIVAVLTRVAEGVALEYERRHPDGSIESLGGTPDLTMRVPAPADALTDARRQAADDRYRTYCFLGFAVDAANGWEWATGGATWARTIFGRDLDRPEEPTTAFRFVVTFDPDTAVVADTAVYPR